MSVASWAVKNKREREREREENRVELCYTACPGCIDLDARDCDRERSGVTFSDGLSHLTHTHTAGTGERTGQCLSAKE